MPTKTSGISRRQAYFLARLFRAPKGQWSKVSLLEHKVVLALMRRGFVEVSWGPLASTSMQVRPIYKVKKTPS